MTERPILYGFWQSSCVWRVRIALAYKEIDHEYRGVDLYSNEQVSSKLRPFNIKLVEPFILWHQPSKLRSCPLPQRKVCNRKHGYTWISRRGVSEHAKFVTGWFVWEIRGPVIGASDECFDLNSKYNSQELFYYHRLLRKKPPNNMLTHKQIN